MASGSRVAILDYCNWVLKVRGTSSDNNLGGGPSVAREDNLWRCGYGPL